MTRRIGLAAAVVAALTMAGCAGGPMERRTQGAILGGATGAALGSLFGSGTGRIVATGVGAVVGSIAGSEIADDRRRGW
jgi:outer membrane lipoprotein SlyB